MLGEAQSNTCFIMPKSLNDNIENSICFAQIFSCSDDKYFHVNYILNTHAARLISNLLLCADRLLDSPGKSFLDSKSCHQHGNHSHAPKRSSLSLHNIGSFVLVTKCLPELSES